MDTSDENNLFLQEMVDVEPITSKKKVTLKKGVESQLSLRARREAAVKDLAKDSNHLSTDHVDMLDPFYLLEFKRPGVQVGVFKKLKRGKYSADARLDLHRMTVEVARKEVFSFIKDCVNYDIRSLIIVHGKGNHSHNTEAQLKSYINKWLPDLDEVQAFASAQPQHGGLGAVYVLLGKSEKKKQENRDRLSRGRIFAG